MIRNEASQAPLKDIVRLDDPFFYTKNPYWLYERLRREAPLYWHESTGFWIVSKYHDICTVLKNPGTFSSSHGVFISDKKSQRDGRYQFFPSDPFPPAGAEDVLNTDPPLHTEYRRTLIRSGSFAAGWAAKLEHSIRKIARKLLSNLPGNTPVNFVDKVATPLTLGAITEFMGLPNEDIPMFQQWTESFMKGEDSDNPEELKQAARTMREMWQYFDNVLHNRNSRSDRSLALVAHAVEHATVPDPGSLRVFLSGMLIAGNITSREAMSGGMIAFSDFPGEWERLLSKSGLARNAAEEILRWVTPAAQACRTVVESGARIRDHQIEKDSFVMLLHASGNRDEEIWEDADRFNIARPVAPAHLTFGHGIHHCIGAHLARLEIKVLLQELARRCRRIRLEGKPEMIPSTLGPSYRNVPIVLEGSVP